MTAGSQTVGFDSTVAVLAARRGTASFSRVVQNFTDRQFDLPSTANGWSRRDIVAYVGYHARRMSELVAAAGHLEAKLRWDPPTDDDVAYGSTLARCGVTKFSTRMRPHT